MQRKISTHESCRNGCHSYRNGKYYANVFPPLKKRQNLRRVFDAEPVKREYWRDSSRSVGFRTDPIQYQKRNRSSN
jgi:hypothetical protein